MKKIILFTLFAMLLILLTPFKKGMAQQEEYITVVKKGGDDNLWNYFNKSDSYTQEKYYVGINSEGIYFSFTEPPDFFADDVEGYDIRAVPEWVIETIKKLARESEFRKI